MGIGRAGGDLEDKESILGGVVEDSLDDRRDLEECGVNEREDEDIN
jgi:hypothetical protein